eukprot:SM000003S11123  [mRNA]  locus=s3:1040958:1044779:- [translate_table: standard]
MSAAAALRGLLRRRALLLRPALGLLDASGCRRGSEADRLLHWQRRSSHCEELRKAASGQGHRAAGSIVSSSLQEWRDRWWRREHDIGVSTLSGSCHGAPNRRAAAIEASSSPVEAVVHEAGNADNRQSHTLTDPRKSIERNFLDSLCLLRSAASSPSQHTRAPITMVHGLRGAGIVPMARAYSTVVKGSTADTRHSERHPHRMVAKDHSQRAVVVALWCNFLVFCLKAGVWLATQSSVMAAEAVHSLADVANQSLLWYGLVSSNRAPDLEHPYGYSKERFIWALVSATGIFCLGSGVTIMHGLHSLWNPEPVMNMYMAALVLGGSVLMEGASLQMAFRAVQAGAKAEGMTFRDYLWRSGDPAAVAVMMEDGAAVTGCVIAAASLLAVELTGNPVWDGVGSIAIGGLLGAVAAFLIQRNRRALLGQSMEPSDIRKIIALLRKDPVVDNVWDCKSEVMGPGTYRFKAEIDFNGIIIVQRHLRRVGKDVLYNQVRSAVSKSGDEELDQVMAHYGEEVVTALGSEVDRLEKEIKGLVPEVLHVDIETSNPRAPPPYERVYVVMASCMDATFCNLPPYGMSGY